MNASATSSASNPESSDPWLLRRCALAAGAVVLAMLAVFVATGVGQDPLQYVHRPADYARILARNPPLLRLAIGLDNAFVLLYSTMFVALFAHLWRAGRPRALTVAAGALIGVSAALDLAENMHFLTMIAIVEHGLDVGAGEIGLQVWASLLKFHASYLGLFLLGWVLPPDGASARALGVLLRWVQWPVGFAIYLVPAELARVLVFGRFSFFVAALLLLATAFRPSAAGSGGRA